MGYGFRVSSFVFLVSCYGFRVLGVLLAYMDYLSATNAKIR